MKQPLLFCVLALPYFAYSQQFTISGTIKDADNLEALIGANIYHTNTLKGTTSNTYGFYSLTLPSDSVTIRYSYVGYNSKQFSFVLKSDTVINVELPASNLLDEVVVTSEKGEALQDVTQMSSVKLSAREIEAMPALLGETDVLKVLQLLPGVQTGSEGSSGIYVRGGGPDQNLILLDGVPVYNASHLFGFFSVFNSDAINNVELIKGGFPARYGGRLSSVIDIQAKEGNMKEFRGEGSVGIIASKLTLEGPIKKEKASFIISGRRTYIDLLTRPIIKAQDENVSTGYYFYDLNAKVNYKVSDRDRLFLSAYMGDDVFYARYKEINEYPGTRVENSDDFGFDWGNITSALRWNRIWTPKLFSNTTLTYSRYKFDISGETFEKRTGDENSTQYYKTRYHSQIRDFATKIDFDFVPSPNQLIKFGMGAIYHEFQPGAATFAINVEDVDIDSTFGAQKLNAWEFSAYIEDDIRITDNLKANLGVHASGFSVRNEFFYSVQPRASLRYLFTPTFSLKASYAEMQQFIHLLTNSGIGLPTDLWVPATNNIKPQWARQAALGLAKNINQTYEVSLEGYYKKMNNLIEYKEGASFLNVTDNWEDKVETGDGESYGMELFLQKKYGKLSGWVGYTLSWTNRTFPNLNNGQTFPYKYDRRHDISVSLIRALSKKIDLSMVWVYGTGNAVSLPVSSYPANRETTWWRAEVKNYDGRNQYRMRDYHRLDINISFKKNTKWGERSWSIGAYNAYNRRNPFFIDLGSDDEGNSKFIQYSLFPVLPSIRYSAKF